MNIIVGGPRRPRGLYNFSVNTLNVTLVANKTFITRPMCEYFYMQDNVKIRSISIYVNTAGAGTGGQARVGVYKLNNGKNFEDGATLLYHEVLDVAGTGSKNLNNLIPYIENNKPIALAYSANSNFTTLPVLNNSGQTMFYNDTNERRRDGWLLVNNIMPSSVVMSDDTDTSTTNSANQITPRMLFEYF